MSHIFQAFKMINFLRVVNCTWMWAMVCTIELSVCPSWRITLFSQQKLYIVTLSFGDREWSPQKNFRIEQGFKPWPPKRTLLLLSHCTYSRGAEASLLIAAQTRGPDWSSCHSLLMLSLFLFTQNPCVVQCSRRSRKPSIRCVFCAHVERVLNHTSP